VASLNGNVFVTPRVIFGLAREGLGPATLARIGTGGTPWAATLVVASVSIALAVSGTFERLLSLAVALVLIIDGFVVTTLFRLRRGTAPAPFQVPFYPAVPLLFLTVYGLLLVATAITQPGVTAIALGAVVVTYGLSFLTSAPPVSQTG
jgi:APA family basic amino acid/polyamine antiporter